MPASRRVSKPPKYWSPTGEYSLFGEDNNGDGEVLANRKVGSLPLDEL